jgi:hypothetical protein
MDAIASNARLQAITMPAFVAMRNKRRCNGGCVCSVCTTLRCEGLRRVVRTVEWRAVMIVEWGKIAVDFISECPFSEQSRVYGKFMSENALCPVIAAVHWNVVVRFFLSP